ncbi:MAG TPA: DUF4157 domain-containing protein [Pyrinomonadaceae bacterium]|nr:DUF4157 domain-containing protein [Pyrinomonadaceae bacterium]
MERQGAGKVQKSPVGGGRIPAQSSARSSVPKHPLLELQRSIGNQAVQRLINSPYIQAKLQVSTPDDPFEQEADRVADTVMRMPEPAATRPSIQRASLAVREDNDDDVVQRQADETSAPNVTTALAANVYAMNGSGSPLPETTRSFFESRFGTNFGDVRVHTDSRATETARSINAKAFTVGPNIAFGPGHYAPHSREGQQLLAHELTHVVQQGASPVSETPLQSKHAASQNAAIIVQTKLDPLSSSVFIQRDNDNGSQPQSASALIDSYISWGNLDEEELGHYLLNHLPAQVGLAFAVLNELPDSDRDDVAYEMSSYATRGKLAEIPDSFRIRMVQELVDGVVTDNEEGEVARIWDSFGDRLPEVAVANKQAWKDSLDESDQLNELPLIVETKNAFPWDVIELARKYIAGNREAILQEGERVGVDLRGTGDVVVEPEYVEGIQKIAAQVSELQSALKQLRQINVGYIRIENPDMDSAVWSTEFPAPFNPDSRPDRPPNGDENPPYGDWQQIKGQYDRVSAVVSSFANLYPSVYVLIQEDRLDELAQAGSAAQAKGVVGTTLRKALEKAQEADQKVATQDISFYDLLPVHARLFSGSSKELLAPRFPWEHPFYQDIGKGILKDHETKEFWVSLGLSLLAAAALIAAPFTGGLTAALLVGVGLGIGAGQAIVSWERYLDLSAVGNAHVRDEFALISKGQITAALVESILNTVGLLLDAFGAKAATATQRAARKAIFEASERELKEQLAREAQQKLVREAAKDAALTGAGAGLGIAQHELFGEEEPQIESRAELKSIDLPMDPGLLTPTPETGVIQRQTNGGGGGGGGVTGGAGTVSATPGIGSGPAKPLTGTEFEELVERALRRGEIGGLPRMDFVIPGQYTGSGWGIDRIGISINPVSGKVSVYHFEMKYVQPGGTHIPGLGTPGAGTQTGLAWTDDAVEGFLTSQSPVARAGRERLRRALQSLHPGEYIDVNRMRAFLRQKLINAPVHIIVPNYADLRRLYRQVAALIRWGRNIRVRPIRMR